MAAVVPQRMLGHMSDSSKKEMCSPTSSKAGLVEDGEIQRTDRSILIKIQPIVNLVGLIFIVAIFVLALQIYVQQNQNNESVLRKWLSIPNAKERFCEPLPWFTWEDVQKYDHFIFDIDGTLKTGDGWIKGAVEFVTKIHEMGKKITIVSNGDWDSPERKAKKLSLPGVDGSNVILPATVMMDKIGSSLKGKKVLAMCPPYVMSLLKEAGANLLNNNFNHTFGKLPQAEDILSTLSDHPEIVILDSWNDWNIEVIDRIVNLVKKPEVLYYILSTDTQFIYKNKLIMADGGSFYAGIRSVVKRNATGFGKPSEAMNEYLRKNLDLRKAVFFGDNIDTDIMTANGIYIDSVLTIGTGVTNEEDWEAASKHGDTLRRPTFKGSFANLMNL